VTTSAAALLRRADRGRQRGTSSCPIVAHRGNSRIFRRHGGTPLITAPPQRDLLEGREHGRTIPLAELANPILKNYSALMPAALMIGHHLSISAF
jgi:hypothetical protein